MGILAIGNGEKCPYCKITITEKIDVLEHMKEKHENEFLKQLFPEW